MIWGKENEISGERIRTYTVYVKPYGYGTYSCILVRYMDGCTDPRTHRAPAPKLPKQSEQRGGGPAPGAAGERPSGGGFRSSRAEEV